MRIRSKSVPFGITSQAHIVSVEATLAQVERELTVDQVAS
jgi:hypothetical protein